MSILEALRMRRKERELSAAETFSKLAADIWAGKKLSEDAIEDILSACGMSDDDLERALTRLDTIAALKTNLVDEASLLDELRQLSLRDQAAEKELVEYRERFGKESEERKSRTELLRRQLDESRKAEKTLQRMRAESGVEAFTESHEPGKVSTALRSR